MSLRGWLVILDVIAWCGGFGGRGYLWAVQRASACVSWVPR